MKGYFIQVQKFYLPNDCNEENFSHVGVAVTEYSNLQIWTVCYDSRFVRVDVITQHLLTWIVDSMFFSFSFIPGSLMCQLQWQWAESDPLHCTTDWLHWWWWLPGPQPVLGNQNQDHSDEIENCWLIWKQVRLCTNCTNIAFVTFWNDNLMCQTNL